MNSCKKDHEPADPDIVFDLPYENQIFNVLDTLHVKARIYSKDQLTGLSVTLVNENLIPVLANYPVSLNPDQGNVVTIDQYIPIDAIQLQSGKYFIWIQAVTSHNSKNKYLSVKLIEVKRKLKKILLLTRSNASMTSLFSLDTTFNLLHQFDFSQDLLAAAIDPLHSVLYVAGKYTGKLTAFYLDSNKILWQKSGPGTPPLTFYQDIRMEGNLLLVSTSDGRLTGYNKEGNIEFFKDFGTIQYPVRNCIKGNILITAVEQKNGNLKFLNNYYYPSGAYQFGLQTSFNIVSILPCFQDILLIAGNQDNTGLITFYYYKEPGLWSPVNFNAGCIKKMLQGLDNHYFALTTYSVQWIQTSTQTVSNFITSEYELEDIQYDLTTDHLLTLTHQHLNIYNFPQASLVGDVQLPDSVKACLLWYNK